MTDRLRYLIAILSNQGGISMNSASKTVKSDKKRLADFKQRVKGVLTQLDLPIVLYAATDKDKFRKPRTGMWDKLLEAQGLTHEGDVDLESCYFVGDAGGRTASARGIKADFSCSDRSNFQYSHDWQRTDTMAETWPATLESSFRHQKNSFLEKILDLSHAHSTQAHMYHHS